MRIHILFFENISGRRNAVQYIAWTDRKQKLKVAIIESNGVFSIAIRIGNHACPVTFFDAGSSKHLLGATHFDGHSFTDVID
jgi:hypothetical protein